MRDETIAIHAGHDPDPAAKSVTIPIHQTGAYTFDNAYLDAALFNLDLPKLTLRPKLATGAAASAIFRNWLEYFSGGGKRLTGHDCPHSCIDTGLCLMLRKHSNQ